MRIVSVDVIKFNSGRSPVPGNSPWYPVAVRVNTDEGVYGLGEIGLAYGNACWGGFGVCRDFAELIIGMDPMENEVIWDRLFMKTFWGQGGGAFVMGAISAIDIALWDIRGKVLNLPVYKLLGGKMNPKLRAYASQTQLDWGVPCHPLIEPEEYAQAALRAKADGYTAVKFNPFMFGRRGEFFGRFNGLLRNEQVKLAEDRVAAVRKAAGEDMDILIELHSLTDVGSAIQICRALEPYRIFVAEEATTTMSAENLREIAEHTTIPMAAGERIYSRWGYAPYLTSHALRMIQPDLGTCGGITEGKKIADMAKTYDISVQAHLCGGPISTAAALQFEAAIPNFLIHEVHGCTRMKENIELCTNDYQPVDGYYSVPELPGIGQDINPDALKAADVATIK